MTRRKETGRTLFLSIISLVLSVSMLVGTTMAWFTDTVTSGVNQIMAGNLDVELYNSLTVGTDKVDSNTKLFNEITYWEPGVVAYENLTVANLGNLALKYQLSVNFTNATTNKNGETLAKVLKVGFVEGGIQSTTREGALTEVKEWQALESFVQPGDLEGKTEHTTDSDTYGIVVYWEPSVIDNEFNMNNDNQGTELKIDLGINLYATQLEAEVDSFGPDYDKDAWDKAVQVSNAEDLQSAINAGVDAIMLTDNVTTGNLTLTDGIKLNLNGNTMTTNLEIPTGATVAITGGKIVTANPDNSAIESTGNLTLDKVDVESDRHGVRVEGGCVVINGGTYKVSGFAGRTQHALNVSDGGEVIINGGTFIGPAGTASDSGAAVNVQAGSKVTINGGNFSGGKKSTLSSAGELIVKGGTFDQKPADSYIAAGYEAEEKDGAWVVTPATDPEDMQDTISNAQDNATIILDKGAYTLPSLRGKEGLTIVGAEDGSTTFAAVNSFNFGTDTKIKNVTFKTSGTSSVRYATTSGDVVYENCVFEGKQYGYHVDNANGGTITFKNCTFYGRNALASSGIYVFENCDFKYTYSNYNTTNIYSQATFTNCRWDSKLELYIDAGAKAIVDGEEITQRVLFISDAKALESFQQDVNWRSNSYAGVTVMLSADIDMKNAYYANWTPIGQPGATQFMGTFDGHGYTIKNLNIDSSKQTGANYSTGLFGWLNAATVKNLKIDGATVTGNHNVGVIAGYMEASGCTISNCEVTNAIIVAKHANDDACGDKVGVIVGHAGNAGVKVENCSVTACTVTAGRDAGQIVGAALTANVIGCSAENVTVTASGECTGANIRNELIGRVLG